MNIRKTELKTSRFEFDIRMHEPTEKLLKHIGFKFNGTAWIWQFHKTERSVLVFKKRTFNYKIFVVELLSDEGLDQVDDSNITPFDDWILFRYPRIIFDHSKK